MINACFLILALLDSSNKVVINVNYISQINPRGCAKVIRTEDATGWTQEKKRWPSITYINGSPNESSHCIEMEFEQLMKKIRECSSSYVPKNLKF